MNTVRVDCQGCPKCDGPIPETAHSTYQILGACPRCGGQLMVWSVNRPANAGWAAWDWIPARSPAVAESIVRLSEVEDWLIKHVRTGGVICVRQDESRLIEALTSAMRTVGNTLSRAHLLLDTMGAPQCNERRPYSEERLLLRLRELSWSCPSGGAGGSGCAPENQGATGGTNT